MSYSKDLLAALWEEALKAEHGVAIEPDDGDLPHLRQELYRTREALMDARLQTLVLHVSPDNKEIWLCKKQTNR